jgi:hypothetical protein
MCETDTINRFLADEDEERSRTFLIAFYNKMHCFAEFCRNALLIEHRFATPFQSQKLIQ